MNGRRSLLKVLAAAAPLGWGAAAAAAPQVAPSTTSDTARTAAALSVLPLLAGGALDAAFLDGVAQAVQAQGGAREPMARLTLNAVSLAHVKHRLDGGLPRRVVALLDDASATLALQLLRAQGARLQVFEPLRLQPSPAGAEQAIAIARALVEGTALPVATTAHEGTPCVALACLI